MKTFAIVLTAAVITATPAHAAQSSGTASKAARWSAPRYTTAATPIGTLLDDPAARAIVDRHLPNTSTDRRIAFARRLTLKAIKPMSGGAITDKKLAAIDADLSRLKRR